MLFETTTSRRTSLFYYVCGPTPTRKKMSVYEEKLKRLLGFKDKGLAEDLMYEADRRTRLDDWLFAWIVKNAPVDVSEDHESVARRAADEAGVDLLTLASAYRDVLAKYGGHLVFISGVVTVQLPVPALSKEALKEFVLGVIGGSIFTSAHIREHDLEMIGTIFMPIVFGGLAGVDASTLGVIYSELSEAGPRGVNGYPTFFSMRLMNTTDWKRCLKAIEKEEKRQAEIEI